MVRPKSEITPYEQNYRDEHGITETPKCPICDNKVKWSPESKRYRVFCSRQCSLSELGKKITHELQVKKMLETKGVTNAAHLESTKQKRKETIKNKYGVEHYSQTDEFKEKYKQTCLERYGVENSLSNGSEARNKYKNTMLETYGEDNASKVEEFKEKRKQTNLEKYGVDNVGSSPEIKEKVKQTCLERYGVPSTLLSEEIRIRQLKTYRENHWEAFVRKLEVKHIKPKFEKQQYIDYEKGALLQYECTRCGNIIDTPNTHPQRIFCEKHNRSISGMEIDVRNWVKEIHNGEVLHNKYFVYDGKKFNVDIYIPEYNLGIEFNGIYWHSELFVDKKYHQQKYNFFKNLGITLVQVFENEWVYHIEKVKSIIKSKLHLNNETYDARKCIVKEIDNKTYDLFCETNHLQGNCNAKIKIGLFHKDELLQLISLSTPRFNKNYQWELIRSCSKLGVNIKGGFSRLITYFKRKYNPENIITYCDARYFNGRGYELSGFELVELTSPGLFYWNRKSPENLFNRNGFQKHLLKDRLEIYDPNKTTESNLTENGYYRIYDAGNLKFVWTKKKEESEDSSNV